MLFAGLNSRCMKRNFHDESRSLLVVAVFRPNSAAVHIHDFFRARQPNTVRGFTTGRLGGKSLKKAEYFSFVFFGQARTFVFDNKARKRREMQKRNANARIVR